MKCQNPNCKNEAHPCYGLSCEDCYANRQEGKAAPSGTYNQTRLQGQRGGNFHVLRKPLGGELQ